MGNKCKLILIIACCFICLNSYGQKGIAFDKDCVLRNSAKLAQGLIAQKGEKFVAKLLEEQIRLTIIWEIDSGGHITKYIRLFPNQIPDEHKELITNLAIEMTDFFKNNDTYFQICMDVRPKISDNFKQELQAKFSEEKTHIAHAAFPGNLMFYYDMKDKKSESGKSQLRYLKKEIKKYL